MYPIPAASQTAAAAGDRLSATPRSGLVVVRGIEPDLLGDVVGRVLTDSAAQRIEDRQALSHQAGGDLPEAVGAVEDGQVGARKTLSGLLDDLGKLVDQHAVQRDPVVRRGRL